MDEDLLGIRVRWLLDHLRRDRREADRESGTPDVVEHLLQAFVLLGRSLVLDHLLPERFHLIAEPLVVRFGADQVGGPPVGVPEGSRDALACHLERRQDADPYALGAMKGPSGGFPEIDRDQGQ